MDKSDLVPLREARSLTSDVWDKHTSNEHKWELLDGIPFSRDTTERDRLTLCLLYSMGLQYFVDELLPDDSKEILKELLTSVNE